MYKITDTPKVEHITFYIKDIDTDKIITYSDLSINTVEDRNALSSLRISVLLEKEYTSLPNEVNLCFSSSELFSYNPDGNDYTTVASIQVSSDINHYEKPYIAGTEFPITIRKSTGNYVVSSFKAILNT